MPSSEQRARREVLTDADWSVSGVSDTLAEEALLSAQRPRIRLVATVRGSSALHGILGHEPIVVAVADHGEPAWLGSAGRALTELLALPENWNSYRARPVDPRAVERALELLWAIMPEDGPLPVIVPTHGGGIQLEWHRTGADLEVEVTPGGSAHVYFEDPEADVEMEAEMSSDPVRLRDLVLRVARPR